MISTKMTLAQPEVIAAGKEQCPIHHGLKRLEERHLVSQTDNLTKPLNPTFSYL